MRRYLMSVPVDAVRGWRNFWVTADSEAEAREKFAEKGGEFESEELEVMGLRIDEAQITDVEDIPEDSDESPTEA